MNELKPCPCCKSMAKVMHDREWDANVSYRVAFVKCQNGNCGLRTKPVCVDGYYGTTTTETDVIEIWNRRAEDVTENKNNP